MAATEQQQEQQQEQSQSQLSAEQEPSAPNQKQPPHLAAKTRSARLAQDAFLHALVNCFGNITAAARASGMDRHRHSYWHKRSASYRRRFARAMDEARQLKCDAIEAEIHRRGVLGWEEVTTTVEIDKDGNRKEKTVRRNSKDTTALIFEAKAEMPEKYRERTEVETKGTVNVNHGGTINLAALRTEILHNDPDYLEFQRQRALQADVRDVDHSTGGGATGGGATSGGATDQPAAEPAAETLAGRSGETNPSANGHASPVRANGQSGEMADGPPPGLLGSGANGHHQD